MAAGVAYTVPTIAITGSPKDYTSVVAARQRQEAADEAKQKSERRKKDEEIRKALRVEPGTYLNFRVPEIEDAFTETINSLQKAQQDGSFRDESDAIFKFKQLVADRQKEKKEWDEAVKGIQNGTHISSGDISRVGSASSPADFQDVVESGAVSVEPNTGRLQFNRSKNVDFRQLWSQLGSKSKDVFKGVEKASDGTEFFKFDYNLPKLQQELSATFDSDPNIEAKATILYQRDNPESKGLKPEDLRVKVKEDWIAHGMEFASEGKWVRKPKPGGLTIKIGDGGGLSPDQKTAYGEFPPTSKMVYTDPADFTKKTKLTGETKNYFGFSGGDFKVTSAPPGESVYNDSGEKVDDAIVRGTTFNQFLGQLVLKSDLKSPTGKVYPKGTPVPIGFEDYAIKNGLAKAAIVANGLSDAGESLSFNASGLTPSLIAKQSEAEKADIKAQIADAEKSRKELQAKIDREYIEARKQRKPQPKPEPKDDAKAKAAREAKAKQAADIAKKNNLPTFKK